jgi:hypothetical protein
MVKEQLKAIRAALVGFAERQAQAQARRARGLMIQGGPTPRGGKGGGGPGSLLVADVDPEDDEAARSASSHFVGAAGSHRRGRASSVGLAGSGDSVTGSASSGTGPRAGDSNSSGGSRRAREFTASDTAVEAAGPVAVAWYSDGSQEALGLQVMGDLRSVRHAAFLALGFLSALLRAICLSVCGSVCTRNFSPVARPFTSSQLCQFTNRPWTCCWAKRSGSYRSPPCRLTCARARPMPLLTPPNLPLLRPLKRPPKSR